MRKIDAFIFDLDGTLMDSEVLYVEATKKALEERGLRISLEDSVELAYGKGWSVIWGEVCERFPGAYDASEEMEEVIRRIFMDLRDRQDVRIAGSVELLKRLSRDFPVAIVSGSPRADVGDGIDLLGIGSHVDFFMGSEDYYSGKPDPTCFIVASEKLRISPSRCLVFEDSTAGVSAAKHAGMYCVGLKRDNAPTQDLSAADEVLEDLADFDLRKFSAR
jgi:HAD superfamily hydrolase (TIGR01509 family)